MRVYTIICLRRSYFADREDYEYTSEWWAASDIVYWQPNRAGYTSNVSEAGRYTAEELEDCAGDGWDWIARPLTRTQITGLSE
tara:strand:- start:786 stop:1034 length:249 start_codon:yes stop_codon:yes gene_type:complete